MRGSDVARLGAVIELLAFYHPSGLPVLLGDREPLDGVEWADLVSGIRGREDPYGRGPSVNLEGFLAQVAAGLEISDFIDRVCLNGWGAVVEAARAFRGTSPMDWNIWVEYIRLSDPLSSRLQDGGVTAMADELGVDRKTIYRRRILVPMRIAREAIGGFQRALFGG
ncbi:MAG: hypothetical protein ACOYJV_01645 [Aminivibrio sp.]|jgi:hypothetical protein